MEYAKVLESKAVIRFQDCDPFNHLNNGKYTDYFMNHREDVLIESYDLNIYKMAKEQGKSWVSGSNQIVYLKPALLMENVVMNSKLIDYTDSQLYVEMTMYNQSKTHIKAVLWASFIHINLLTQKRDKHSDELMQLFKNVHNPVEEKFFEQRIQTIKTNEKTKKEVVST